MPTEACLSERTSPTLRSKHSSTTSWNYGDDDDDYDGDITRRAGERDDRWDSAEVAARASARADRLAALLSSTDFEDDHHVDDI